MTLSLSILIVDDEEGPLKVIGEILTRAGFQATMVLDSRHALDLAREDLFDLVVTDRQMTRMSGDQLALEIKKHDSTLPVLMVTGTGHAMNARGERPSGVDVVLAKPFKREELLDAVHALLGTKNQQ